MATPSNIRHWRYRLLSIVLLGLVTSALSLLALMRAVSSTSEGHRLERASDAVVAELEAMSRTSPTEIAKLAQKSTYVGLRRGWIGGPGDVLNAEHLSGLPVSWRAPLERAVLVAAERHGRVVMDTPLAPSTLVLAVAPAESGGFLWTGYLMAPSSYLRPWRYIVVALAALTALLAATTLWGVYAFRRSTSALSSTLVALGKNLNVEVPSPRIAELTGIADGIRRMAADLLASREATDRLGRELAQQERLAALGRVAAGVAHEVRNPLASIKLRLDLVAASQELPETTRRGVEAASQEISRLDRLVGDLLLVAGKKMGPRSPTDLGELVRARIEALGLWAEERHIRLHVEGAGVAEIDAESLGRAVDNLLRNAVDASPRGGDVFLRVTTAAKSVELVVEDCGPGVEAARASELFEPFFTTKSEGMGLGLAISRAIVRAHGGDLTYARLDEVTRFSLSIPTGTAVYSMMTERSTDESAITEEALRRARA